MRVRRIVLTSLTTMLCLIGNLQAQSDSGTTALCLSAHPYPACGLFLLTNFGAYARLDGRTNGRDRLGADWGAMINITPRDAVGASYYASVDLDQAFEAGPALRYRRWFNAHGALDVGVGLGTVSGNNQAGRSVYAMVKFSPAPWIGLAVRRSGRGTLLGVEFGSAPGAVLTVAAPIVALVAYAAHPGI